MLYLLSNKHKTTDSVHPRVPSLAKTVLALGADFSLTYDYDKLGVNIFIMADHGSIDKVKLAARMQGFAMEEL